MRISCSGTMSHVKADDYRCDECGKIRTVPDRIPSMCGMDRLATAAELAHKAEFVAGPDRAYWYPMLAHMPRRGIALASYVGGGAGAYTAFGWSRGTCLGEFARWNGPDALERAQAWLDRVWPAETVRN